MYWRMSEDLNFRLSQNIWFEFIIYLNKFVLKNAPCLIKAQIFLEGGCMYIKKGKRSEKR